MKKTLTIAIVFGACMFAYAQKPLATTPYPGHSQHFLESLKHARSMGQDVYVDDTDIPEAPQQAPAAMQATAQEIGYLNPAGTLFLGMDETGKGTFFKTPGVIGAWSDSIPCWKWLNQRTGYKSVKYQTAFSYAYPSYCDGENYEVDANGNFCDTILASGGYQDAYAMNAAGDEGYYWQHATPLQTTKFNDGTEKTFMLLSNSLKPSAENCPIAAGGLPSANTTDGMWPLTNAVNINKSGISMDLIAATEGDGHVSYYFGSSALTTDSFTIPNAAQTGDSMVYERYRPIAIHTRYDKPQSPLYIKSVSLAIGSDQYNAFNQSDLHFDTLYLSIQDEFGQELAQSIATEANLSNMTYKKGKMLTFLLQDTTEYGEVMNEGVIVKDAFQVEITGLKETDNWGIYAAACAVHPTKTEMLYEGGLVKTIDYEPYIMLNGIYPTLENYYTGADFDYGQVEDTISVNMVPYPSSGYKYIASYAKLGADYNEFAFYSTFTPYDTDKRTWNLEVEQPDYIQMVVDYELNLGSDDDPVTIWEYLRVFTVYIYATETPHIGDYIKLGKAGKYIYLRFDEINGERGVESIAASAKAEKVVKDGQVLIRKNGNVYNTIGQKIQ